MKIMYVELGVIKSEVSIIDTDNDKHLRLRFDKSVDELSFLEIAQLAVDKAYDYRVDKIYVNGDLSVGFYACEHMIGEFYKHGDNKYAEATHVLISERLL